MNPPGAGDEGSALVRAERVGRDAARAGFDWPSAEGPLAKVTEELEELREALAGHRAGHARVVAELGDLLFAVVNVARHVGVRPADALHAATDRFEARFASVAAALARTGRRFDAVSLAELDALWEAAKRETATAPAAGQTLG